MMKRFALLFLASLLAVAAVGEAGCADSILRLLNTRASSGPRAYAAAAAVVADEARRGEALPQFLVAVLSETPDWPAAERLTEAARKRYLAASAPRIKSLADGGQALAWYLLYLRDHDAAALQKAVDGGNVQALNTVGTLRLTEVLETTPDTLDQDGAVKRMCFGYFKRAADLGDANGLNNLGLCHQNGWGCAKDEAAAFACFSKAAQKGHAEAVNNLGRFHREGICVKKDLAAALRCFRLSAAQGNASGQLNYALALLRGEGIAADAARGLELLEGLAAAGQAEAMDCLAECYAKGVGGLTSDARKSLYWMFRARAARGDRHAAKWLKENDESTHDR